MEQLSALVEQQVRRHLNVTPEEFDYLTHPNPNHLHDPFYYKGMRELVTQLHQFKKKQEKDPSLLLAIDGDYDTDGICATAVLAAALSLFGFSFCVHIPTMAEGYGLTPEAVTNMQARHNKNGQHIAMILTADNGIKAFKGVQYAKALGIDVLITDHHPAEDKLPDAKAVVDAYQNGDLYPFKGNSGACVAWKTMLAYTKLFAQEKESLIEKLIVFAGLSNVADSMPICNENRYTVTAALEVIKKLRKIPNFDYTSISNTGHTYYDSVFHGLYDLVALLQEAKDIEREKAKKTRIPLPDNEELFSWYLSPMLNAPRRVHDTSLEGMSVFLISDPKTRHFMVKRLIALNAEKSVLRDRVLEGLPKNTKETVFCANTQKGISGLVAASLTNRTGLPSVVFSCLDESNPNILYTQAPDRYISGSARSNELYPLHKIMDEMNKIHPGIVKGGGHATGAGFSIWGQNFEIFQHLFYQVLPKVKEQAIEEANIVLVPANNICLHAIHPEKLTAEVELVNEGEIAKEIYELDRKTFASDAKTVYQFLQELRPFGSGYMKETTFQIVFDKAVYAMGWNPDFWKTFKFSLFGVEILTFDTEWAVKVKTDLEAGQQINAIGNLKLNEFRGNVTPQIVIGPVD